MILNDVDLGLGEVVITDSRNYIKKQSILSKCVDIYSKDHNYRFTFWTTVPYENFKELKLDTKTDILGYIDDHDICFGTRDNLIINSRENTRIYFTKIDDNKYTIDAEIFDFDNVIIGDTKGYKNLKINASIIF